MATVCTDTGATCHRSGLPGAIEGSDFVSTNAPSAQKVKVFDAGNVGSVIKNNINHRRSKTLKKLTSILTASAKVVVKKKSKKKKQTVTYSQHKKKTKISSCNSNTSPQSCPTTAMATPVATAAATTTVATPIVPTQVSVPNAYYVRQSPPTPPIPRQPSNPRLVAFHEELRALTERIALNPDNTCGLDSSECANKCCPYSSGNLLSQRYNLMVRSFQINHLLSTSEDLRSEHLRKLLWP